MIVMSKILFSLVLLFFVHFVSAQYSIIPTGTTRDIDEIEKVDSNILIMGNSNFFVRCSGDCYNLESILPVGIPSFTRNISLFASDTSNYYFLNSNSMLPSIYSKLYKTSDGGQNWEEHLLPNSFVANQLIIFDTSYYLAINDEIGYVSTNSGLNWTQGINFPFNDVTKSLRLSDSIAYIGGYQQIGLTTNQGINWSTDNYMHGTPLNFANKGIDSVYFVANSAVNSTLSYIFNAVLSNRVDRVIPGGTLPIGIYVASQHEIYVTGKDYATNKGRILKTTDLGLTWTHFDIQENKYLADLVPLNDSIFLIGGQGGLLIKWNKNAPMQPITLGIDEEKNVLDVRIFPNPSGTIQHIEINNPLFERVEVSVFDALGRDLGVFFMDNQPELDNKIIIDLAELPKGTFFYRIKLGNQIIHKPFQKL